ncbi:MAG: SDR family NAD(P)-dependent oxidoreductase [Bacteroidetes bacterium]|nr:SDR family NAD(P)-dependent oxidoreductase [Bacteroidota bacterium]
MRKVLITGANRGYGLALMDECVKAGDRVFATCRKGKKKDIEKYVSSQCTVIETGLIEEAEMLSLVNTISQYTDSLDLLINNAGKLGGDSFETFNPLELIEHYKTNALSPLLLSRACTPLLEKGENPCIVMSSSSWGSIGYKWDPTNNAPDSVFGYCGSKAALNMYSRTLAAALKPKGIRVIIHHPGGKGDPGGGPESRSESALATLRLVDRHNIDDTGKFYHWRGYELPW